MTDPAPTTRTDAAEAATLVAPMARLQVRLGDLGLAKENLRFAEPADDGIPQLADTILAAGVVIAPIVRAGRKGEEAYVALDGRRRRLALLLLKERGAIDDDFVVECQLAETKAQQTAAILLPNTEHAPVHIADVIVAIGRLRKARMDTASISKALGYSELEIKRLEALASVHPTVLKALRQGKLTLKQVRLFARVDDKARQAEIAETALSGYFQDYHLRQIVEGGRMTVEDPRFTLVGMDRYLAAGGRVTSDLFGELPDALLNPEVLQAVWRERIQPIVDHLKAEGLAVYIGTDGAFGAPEGFNRLPYVYHPDLSEPQEAALSEARAAASELSSVLQEVDPNADEAPAAYAPLASAMAAVAGAPLTRDRIGAVMLSPGDNPFGWTATFYSVPLPADQLPPEDAYESDPEADDDGDDGVYGRAAHDVEVPRAEVQVDGSSHVLHEVRTDVATRGLIRDLADHPSAALTVLVAQLFKQLALQSAGSLEDSAVQIVGKRYSFATTSLIAELDGEIKARLEARRAAYKVTGLRPIPWVETLADGDKLVLLAELTAIALNLRESRTSSIRDSARAEAAEIAALCKSEISAHWTPDTAFLTPHPKTHLLAMLDAMGVEDDRARSLKKEDLVAFVANVAAERRWAPPILYWGAGRGQSENETPEASGESPEENAPEGEAETVAAA